MKKLYFIHDSKAFYSSVQAAKEILKDDFFMEEVTYAEAAQKSDIAESICWYIMGFYPKKLPAALTIHDYLSLSVGKFPRLKDFIKTTLNARPDMRIIQTSIKDDLKFNDNVKTFFIDIGVPEAARDLRDKQTKKKYDFCYFGVISRERKLNEILKSFIKRFGASKNFILVGNAEPAIVDEFSAYPNIIFAGPHSQRDLFQIVKQSRVSVCYVPGFPPYDKQTATKLLESAVLKARILANKQAMNIMKAKEFGLNIFWGENEHDLFANVPDELTWPDNGSVNPRPMMWLSMLKISGIMDYLFSFKRN